MSSNQPIASAGRPLTPGAVALMLMLCLSWGFNQIAVKLALPDIPPMLQATIRSAGALVVLFLIARLRGVKLFERDGTLRAGLFAGLLFGLEFVLIYRGLLLTSASRAVVFLYTAPFFVALGSYQFLGERLRASQWGGLALCFTGVALAIGVPQADVDASVLLGDLLIVGGGALWAATTLLVKATPLLRAPPEKALGYQVALSVPILGFAAWISGETLTAGSRPAGADPDGLSGDLGGRIDLFDLVRAGQDLFRQQIVGIYLYHPFVWRGG
jgi:drug/metabolite transporter (DMT)-like permease